MELNDETRHGYLGIYFQEAAGLYDLEFVVWSREEPGRLGRCLARAAKLDKKFTSSGVQRFTDIKYENDPRLQIELSLEAGVARVKTTEAFREGPYVFQGFREDVSKSGQLIDGIYVFKSQ